MPNTLFRLDNDTRYAVVEMGMDHLGEIERLARCGPPLRRHHHDDRRVPPGKSRHPREYTESKNGDLRRPA